MEETTIWLIAFLKDLNPYLGFLCLALASVLEYLFPPFPGDTVVLIGASLSESVGWSLMGVVVAVMFGNVLGAWLVFEMGRWMGTAKEGTWLYRLRQRPSLSRAIARSHVWFDRHGIWTVGINRFLPGLRAAIFIAAGLAEFDRLKVLSMAFFSSLCWSLLIVLVGFLVGFELSALLQFLEQYIGVVKVLLGFGLFVWLVRWWLKRRQCSR